MSDSASTIVEISITASNARMRAVEVREWLVEAGIVTPNLRREPLGHPSDFLPGDRAASAAPGIVNDENVSVNTGVDVILERALHHPTENYEPPTCPSCGEAIEEGLHHSLIEPWLAGDEPNVRCESCGVDALIGDWTGRWTFQVGELAVRFNNWPPLNAAFTDQLGRKLGNRWRVVLEHS